MPTMDAEGRQHGGMFENVTLPDGRVAKPVSGRGDYITYDIDGMRVESRSGDPIALMWKLTPSGILADTMIKAGRK